jgi:hypothetical protein
VHPGQRIVKRELPRARCRQIFGQLARRPSAATIDDPSSLELWCSARSHAGIIRDTGATGRGRHWRSARIQDLQQSISLPATERKRLIGQPNRNAFKTDPQPLRRNQMVAGGVGM